MKINLGEVAYILRALNWYEDRLGNVRDDFIDDEEIEIIKHVRERLSGELREETYL